MAHQTDVFSEREFEQWLVLLLESERRRLREPFDPERERNVYKRHKDSSQTQCIEGPCAKRHTPAKRRGGKPSMNAREKNEIVGGFPQRTWVLIVLLVASLVGAGVSRAQTPVSITDSSTPIAFTTNNTGSAATFVLNADSSVSVLKNTGITVGECAPFLASASLLRGAIYFDPSTSRVYIATEGNPPHVTFNTINTDGSCTVGADVVSLTDVLGIPAFAGVEMTVDCCGPIGHGNVYVAVTRNGGIPDALFFLDTKSFANYVLPSTNASFLPVPQVGLDDSASYGPIIVDPSSHIVYINDFGDSQNGPPGFNATPGFFVFDPSDNLIEQVMGYVNPANTKANNNISAQTLLVDGKGKLIIVNQNTSPASALTFNGSPFTILDTTKFSFFSNTQSDGTGLGSEPRVFIEPPATAVNVVAASLNFSATSAADIDTTNGIVYAFAYDATEKGSSIVPVVQTGALVSYGLSSGKETLLADTLSIPSVTESGTAPWSQITFNSPLNDLMFFTPSGALGVSTPLACTPVEVDQVLGGGSGFYSLTEPAFNFSSGLIYDAETIFPNTTLFYTVPPSKCATSGLILSPTTLANGVAGKFYGPVTFTATNSVGASFSASGLPPGMHPMTTGGVLSGTPTTTGPFEVAVMASDSNGDTGSETVLLDIVCPTITVGPAQLPGGIIGVPYSATFTQTGGVGSISFAAFGPFPPGISANSSGLSGTPTQAGTTMIGVQATDSNGCKSAPTTPVTVSIATPTFGMSPASGVAGASQCQKGVFGFPTNIPPIVNINGVNYFQVQLNLFNSGNLPANANLTSAALDGFQPTNISDPGTSDLPIVFNNPGTLLQPGGCVSLSLFYPTSDFGNPVPAGVTHSLKLQGNYTMTTNQVIQGTWTLTDVRVHLGAFVEDADDGASATGELDAKRRADLDVRGKLTM